MTIKLELNEPAKIENVLLNQQLSNKAQNKSKIIALAGIFGMAAVIAIVTMMPTAPRVDVSENLYKKQLIKPLVYDTLSYASDIDSLAESIWTTYAHQDKTIKFLLKTRNMLVVQLSGPHDQLFDRQTIQIEMHGNSKILTFVNASSDDEVYLKQMFTSNNYPGFNINMSRVTTKEDSGKDFMVQVQPNIASRQSQNNQIEYGNTIQSSNDNLPINEIDSLIKFNKIENNQINSNYGNNIYGNINNSTSFQNGNNLDEIAKQSNIAEQLNAQYIQNQNSMQKITPKNVSGLAKLKN